ncbi:NAD(P)H-binding protein [Aestuariibacter halophilus]|uniref:NAD(P)H-binding protein n=1 Tax=Fluctibacter halophilus TaxID=226011 RepID=A0ABS8G9E1_9ALTE|nr:NAD-dependent epimerase/dehydratase family protein [Aestuariibacter halophilus]MCC2617113.1 NAD(P)H-binding protein [Aestuariibacter halophilus]
MHVMILGGTGNIGAAIVNQLHQQGATLSVLCRSTASCQKAESMGATPLQGDLCDPTRWARHLQTADALVHVACNFDHAMAATDHHVTTAIIEQAKIRSAALKVLYTGGIWCFGSADEVITEQTQKAPVEAFRWMVENGQKLQNAQGLETQIIHPANVVSFDQQLIPSILHHELADTGSVRVPVDKIHHWPRVEVNNLAEMYVLALSGGAAGNEYLAAADGGTRLEDIAAPLMPEGSNPVEVLPIEYWTQKYGHWASGYACNQQVSSQHALDTLGWQAKHF